MGISVLSGHEKRQFMANSISSDGTVIGHERSIPTSGRGSYSGGTRVPSGRVAYSGGPRVLLRIQYKTQSGIPANFVSTLSFKVDKHPVGSHIRLIYEDYDHTNVKLLDYYEDQGYSPQLFPLGLLSLLIGLIFLYLFRNVGSIIQTPRDGG